MAITSDNETRQTTTTVVTVRVPNGDDGDLTTNAQRRLCRADGVAAVTIDDIRALQPGLSATEVTVRVTVTCDGARPDSSVEAAMRDLTSVSVSTPTTD